MQGASYRSVALRKLSPHEKLLHCVLDALLDLKLVYMQNATDGAKNNMSRGAGA